MRIYLKRRQVNKKGNANDNVRSAIIARRNDNKGKDSKLLKIYIYSNYNARSDYHINCFIFVLTEKRSS